jgi:phosphatidate cytidylyltransferase
MLKQRILTALVLIPLVVAAILKLPGDALHLLLGLVALLAAWEWMTVIGFSSRLSKFAGLIALTAIHVAVMKTVPVTWIMMVSTSLWGLAFLLVLGYAHRPLPKCMQGFFASRLTGFIAMVLVLIPFVLLAALIQQVFSQGPELLLFALVSVWLADTGGYFAGKRFGKHKLATQISPNKTWEGVAGALVLAGIWAVIAYQLGLANSMSLTYWLLLTLVTVAISIVGDLFESLFKRLHQVKDSGQLLPGHGGILDRIDSVVAAIPIFLIGLSLAGVR